jgi:hypothetical protein
VHWPKEDLVVAAKDLHDGQKEIGQTCSVRIGKRLFPGRIAEIGKKLHIDQLLLHTFSCGMQGCISAQCKSDMAYSLRKRQI